MIVGYEQDFKKRVHEVIKQKQLCSVMNDTKWGNLQSDVLNKLPFTPPYQAKYVLDDIPYPENFENDVWYLGDWIEGLSPFFSVEWIRVRPRYQKHKGNLLPPELIDISKEFLSILHELRIPYREENNTFFIYGYISNTDSLFKGNQLS
ncbi:hypothetical protein BSK48_16480 [Paenibacillus odorifer]|nr:hypothetical protein BSK48_16480 [Paenibacillus odorifer]